MHAPAEVDTHCAWYGVHKTERRISMSTTRQNTLTGPAYSR